ncbi:MAG: FliH/SctL family protein [Sphaerobacter sp.]|nr:FliH/SctL family protein [Sphaerobacter sp.]
MPSARIIKHWIQADEAYPLVPRPARHDRERALAIVAEAEERAAAIVAEAEAHAAAVRWQAEQERERMAAELREAALAQAREEARAEFAAMMDEAAARFLALVEQATLAEEQIRRACQADAVALAIAIAERILQREIARDPATVARIAEAALAQTQGAPVTQILAHPDDVPILAQWVGQSLGGVEIVADPHVGRGGCVIGTRVGFLDARIETQLAEVRAALAEELEDA